MKELSDYEISELLCMLSEIKKTLRAYLHVSDKVPGLVSKVDKIHIDLCTESDKRES